MATCKRSQTAEYRFRIGVKLRHYMYKDGRKVKCDAPGAEVGDLRRYDVTVAAESLEDALDRAEALGREQASILSWNLPEEEDCYGCYEEYRFDQITPLGIVGVTDCSN